MIMADGPKTEILRELKKSLESFLGDRLLRMVLFGSMARGDYNDKSDVDVAIIIRGLTRELKHQILDKVAEVELNHLTPISTLILSEDEFSRLKKEKGGSPLISIEKVFFYERGKQEGEYPGRDQTSR